MRYLCIIPIIALAGCVGQRARDNALMPAMQLAWPGVKEDVERGPVIVDTTSFDSDIKAGVFPTYAEWTPLQSAAYANIDAAQFSEGIKVSRRERVKQFDRAVQKGRP